MNNSNYRRAFTDILQDVVSDMPTPVITIFKVITLSAGVYQLYVDDFYYTAFNYNITIGTNTYLVTSLDDTIGNNKITITGSALPTTGTFTLYQFFFFHGTPVDTAQELADLKSAENKYPMIWLWEEFSEEMNWDEGEAPDRKTTCFLYFLDQSDPKLGPTENRWEAYVKPMYRLRDYFMNYLKSEKQFFMTWDQTTKDKPKNRFGVWLSSGKEKQLFADNLSGVEMNGTFTVFKNANDFKSC